MVPIGQEHHWLAIDVVAFRGKAVAIRPHSGRCRKQQYGFRLYFKIHDKPLFAIGAKDQHQLGFCNKGLVIAGRDQAVFDLLALNIDNRIELLVSGARRGNCRLQDDVCPPPIKSPCCSRKPNARRGGLPPPARA